MTFVLFFILSYIKAEEAAIKFINSINVNISEDVNVKDSKILLVAQQGGMGGERRLINLKHKTERGRNY